MKTIRRYSNDLAVVHQGFKQADEYYLRHYDNPVANPPTQIIAYSEREDEEEQIDNNTKYCPNCTEFTLRYIDKLDVYFCFRCSTEKTKEYANDLLYSQSGLCVNEDNTND